MSDNDQHEPENKEPKDIRFSPYKPITVEDLPEFMEAMKRAAEFMKDAGGVHSRIRFVDESQPEDGTE